MQDYLDEDGQPLTLQQLTREEAAAIKELTMTESFDDKTGKLTRTHYRCRLQDKRAALVDLGKHLGLFSINVVNNVNVTNNNVNVSRETGQEAFRKLVDELNQTRAAQDAEAQATEVEPLLALPPPPPPLRLVIDGDASVPSPNDVIALPSSDVSAPKERSTTQQYYDWMARNLDKPP
jgi:hypothetical protein